MKPFRYSSSDWLGKVSAALAGGFFLALGLSGIFTMYGLGGVSRFSLQHQVSMWLMSPILVALLSTCFLFRSGVRAWCWLGAANVAVWGLLYLKHF